MCLSCLSVVWNQTRLIVDAERQSVVQHDSKSLIVSLIVLFFPCVFLSLALEGVETSTLLEEMSAIFVEQVC